MASQPHTEIPVHNTPGYRPASTTKPMQRHRTRYYAHRVKESCTSRVGKLICGCLLGLVLVLGLLAFILWLSLRPHRPRFHVVSFSVPGINSQQNGFQNAAITFEVTVRNPNLNVEIYYGQLDGTVFYRDQQIGTTPLLFPFHQPSKNTTLINGVISGASLSTTDTAGTVVFRLELTSSIRFKVVSWTTKDHRMHASCDVGVGPDGQIAAMYKDRICSIYFD